MTQPERPHRRVAVIDVGTNSVKLLVADVARSASREIPSLTPIHESGVQTRLGAGLYATGSFTRQSLDDTTAAVARHAALARDLGAAAVRIIATSAARESRDPALLADRLRPFADEYHVISGDIEAAWVHEGVGTDPRFRGKPLRIVDVGGGSTEWIASREKNVERRMQSFPLGTVRLLHAFPPGDPPDPEVRHRLSGFLAEHFIREVAPWLAPLESDVSPIFVATGGTAVLLARLHRGLSDFNRERIEETTLTAAALPTLADRLWSLPIEERRRLPGLPTDRADVILFGAAILEAAMRHLGFRTMHVSTRGLRFGAALDLAGCLP